MTSRTAPVKLGRPTLIERPRGETREMLLRAAAEVFAEDGYSSASVSKIGERVGITSGAVYRHFNNKADILLALVKKDLHAIPITEKLASNDRPSIGFFGKLVSMYVDPSLYLIRRLSVELHAAAARDNEAAELLKEFTDKARDSLCERLDAAKRNELLPAALDVRQTANVLLILMMGLANLDTLDPSLIGSKQLMRFLEASVRIMLTTDAG